MKNMSKAHNALNYSFTKDEEILVDTNVWIFLYPPTKPPASHASQDYKYSIIFKKLREANARPIISSLILSEYFNRYIQCEYRGLWERQYKNRKKFRQSTAFTSVGQAATNNIRNILTFTELRDTLISQIDLSSILKAIEDGACEFNDAVYVEICRKQGWKMLTHDADMAYGGIELLTTNESLLGTFNLIEQRAKAATGKGWEQLKDYIPDAPPQAGDELPE